MEIAGSFGEQLRRLREAAGLTQEALAERAGLTGKAVGALERGKRQYPYPHTVRALADALGLDDAEHAALIAARPRRDRSAEASPRPAPLPKSPASGTAFSDASVIPEARLPVPLTTVLGREFEQEEARNLIERLHMRLVTLTGPGGVGKTRLAIAIAADLLPHFQRRVAFVDLTPISDPALVIPQIARSLGIGEIAGRSLPESLARAVGDGSLLLVLDNLEQVLGAAVHLVELLEVVPGLTILTTSRAALHVRWEREIPVPPLPTPAPRDDTDLATLVTVPSIALFIERAQAVQRSFTLTPTNAVAVAELCRRLDGLPLAIELAAVRLQVLSPATLLARLGQRMDLLAATMRDVPARHRTIRATIGWSYDLLTPDEQQLFAWLSVFVGGCTSAAATISTARETDDGVPLSLIDRLTSLVDSNLLQASDGAGDEPRFRMLETIRSFAAACLAERGEEEIARARHAAWYLAFAERAAIALGGPDQSSWLDRLARDADNLRAALIWATARGDGALAVRLAAALWRFWYIRGPVMEGCEWMDRVLAIGEAAPSAALATAYYGAGSLQTFMADYARATTLCTESLAIFRALGDEAGIARALHGLGVAAMLTGDYDRAADLYGESLTRRRAIGDAAGVALSAMNLGAIAMWRGDLTHARALHEESLNLQRRLGDRRGIAVALTHLGAVALAQGDLDGASALLQESLERKREGGYTIDIGESLLYLGALELRRGDPTVAERYYREALVILHEIGPRSLIPEALRDLARVSPERPDRIARLLGAAASLPETLWPPLGPDVRNARAALETQARAALGPGKFAASWATGQALTVDETIAEALAGSS
jgi:predicted ATPase/DNA-binding XRE family transcriptional regulator